MNHTIGWSLGVCCGLPLLGALLFAGGAGVGSYSASSACLTVTALALGYVGFRFFTREDEDDERELDELDHVREMQPRTRR